MIHYYEYCQFDGTSSANVTLPFTLNADYKVIVDFMMPVYHNDQSVVGNTSNYIYSHLTEYNSRWYFSTGTSEGNYSASDISLYTRHKWTSDATNGNYIDDTRVSSYSGYTNSSIYYKVGGRNSASENYYGYIYDYQLESLSTGEILCHLRPAKDDEHEGLYDVINDTWYTGGKTVYNIIRECKYLIKSGDSYYTITSTPTTDDDGNETTEKTLTELTDVTELTAETFSTYGLDDIPEWSDYSSLENPTVLCWSEDEAQEMTATVTGTPYPQTIISRPVELIDSTVLGIDSISATASTDALFAFSFDGGTTWEVYLTDTTAWSTVTENSGITATALDEIGSDIWTAKIKDSDGNKIDSFLIRVILPSTSAYFTNMTVTFLN